MLNKNRKVYFIGIGGIGMSGLAEILINNGYKVSGSDKTSSNLTERLRRLKAEVHYCHNRKNISNADLIVRSTAITDDNVEILEAKKRGIPIISRGDLLADLVRLKPNSIAVAGSHGKTTTTSMVASILDEADIESTMIVGGVLRRKGRNACWGKGNYLVTESDEHDGSFLKLAPTVSVVTNIDREHLAYYKTFSNVKKAFYEFIHKIPFYGFSILCGDDPSLREMARHLAIPFALYGLDDRSDLYPRNIKFSADPEAPEICFDVRNSSRLLGRTGKLGLIKIKAIGMHNVSNALASIAVGLGLGISFDIIKKGLMQFEGVERRLQVKKVTPDCVLIEDYAHHPTEIKETIKAVRTLGKRRLIVIFQPHLYSRTRDQMPGFINELLCADIIFVTAIYPAREKPIKGISARHIVDGIKKLDKKKQVFYVHNKDKITSLVLNNLRKNDIVLVIGAGNVYTVTDKIQRMLNIQVV